MTFVKGQSGNPAGRPRGSRNRAALAAEAQMEAVGEELARKAIELARSGNNAALRLCLGLVMPRGRERPVCFAMPRIESAADVRAASTEVAAAMGRGELSPAEAMDVLRVIDEVLKLLGKADAMERAQAARTTPPEHHPTGAAANGGIAESSELQAERPRGDGAGDAPPGEATRPPARAATAETSELQAGRPGGDHAERPANGAGTTEPARQTTAETSRIEARTPAGSAAPVSGWPAGGRAQAEAGSAATADTSGIQARRPGDRRPWPDGGADTWWSFAPAVPLSALAETSRIQAHPPPGGARQASRWEGPGLLGNAMLAPVLAALERHAAGR